MAIETVPQESKANSGLPRPVELTCIALCMANAFSLAAAFIAGIWLLDANGHAISSDFVNVWAAGRQAVEGHLLAAYDIALHKQAEVAALGGPFAGHYPWNYPPTFFLVAIPLSLLPLAVANLAWIVVTFPGYAATIRGIIGQRFGLLFACAYPGIMSNAMVGQNGFLTAALFGSGLLFVERRPILAGLFFGLLSFKPHLGILIPLALAAGGHRRVFASAAVVVALMALGSWILFGTGAWQAFFQSLTVTAQGTLADGQTDWGKLQSLLGLSRWLGGGETVAWALQSALTAVVAVLLVAVWRSMISFDLKAATLVTAALLVTPYLFLYDLMVLAVPMAFLLRASLRSQDMPMELARLSVPCLLILVFPFVSAPVGFGAIMATAVLIGRRGGAELASGGGRGRDFVADRAPLGSH